MSQSQGMDTSMDQSMFFDGDISVLPSNIDQLINEHNFTPSTQEKESTPYKDVSTDLLFSRSHSSSNRKLRLPKIYTNVNKLNKFLFKDHKLLIKPLVSNKDEILDIVKQKCKIWKVINDKNVNDKIMSLDIPYIMDNLIKEYQKNIFFEKQSALTTLKTLRGKNLTQFEYNLIMHNLLTPDNLLIHNFTTMKNRNVKLQSLQLSYKRFFDPKTKRIVVVHQKTFKEVIPPFLLIETILHIHLINNHMKTETLYRNLTQRYYNTTRNSVITALQCCNICRKDIADEDIDQESQKESISNIFSEQKVVMESIQIECYTLADNAEIVTFKDLHSQYLWMEELDNKIDDHNLRISQALKKWLLNTAIITPITFFSISIDCDTLHNIVSSITDSIDEKMGVVYVSTNDYKHMRKKATEEFESKTLEQCYKYIHQHNITYRNSSKGLPKKLLYGTAFDFNGFEEIRREKVSKYTSWDNVFIEQ
ncbi:hypothetical protein ACO0OL_003047 [Hanseniaspora opuntiae]